ncbi:Exonuclease III [Sphingobacterium wenxiniae]|uniref:Exonuclease III n=2 Tax=Sphingobacterium wenxiniae TaxID=683125 RepID=A0A1I6VQ08_9SPHI|nr:Exonuclease III [Sphingobacterium wenxiniae]
MKLIYWNSKKQSDFKTIECILGEENPDILFLSESNKNLFEDNKFYLELIDYEHFENPGCQRVIILKKKNLKLSLAIQSPFYTSVKCLDNNIFIISVHLPSQMFQHMDGLKSHIRLFRQDIDSLIGDSSKVDIIVIGDFNVNPFEKPMIDFDGFAASNSVNLRKKITHLQNTKELYYNPTWKLYRENSFPGTKYFRRPSASAYDVLEHHFLDQVVVSYSLSQKIIEEKIKVLEETTTKVFFDKMTSSILESDHLPLIYEFKT